MSAVMRTLERIVEPLNRALIFVVAGILTLMMLLTVADVTGRYLFNRPILGTLELQETGLTLMVFLGLGWTQLRKVNPRVDVLVSRFPERTQMILESLLYLCSLAMMSILSWRLVVQAFEQWQFGRESPILGFPAYPIYFLIAFGGVVLSLVLLRDLLDSLVRLGRASRGDWLWLLLGGLLSVTLFTVPVWLNWLPWQISPPTYGLIGVTVMIVLLFLKMPVGFLLATVGFIGFAYLTSPGASLAMTANVAFRSTHNYVFVVLPLFLLMGQLAGYGGLSRDLYVTARKWLGHLPGGLAMATVAGSAGFGACCGASVAAAATMATVAWPEMRNYKFDGGLATGSIAAGGTLAILIPPSMGFIVYGLLTGQSISRLFIAGIIPGILLSGLFMVMIFVRCKLNPELGPLAPATSLRARVVGLKDTWGVLVLFGLVIGGIYAGIFTPTEGGGVGAFGALVLTLGLRRLSWRNLWGSLVGAAETTSMLFLIFIGAMIFSYFLARSQLPMELAEFLVALPVSRYVILAGILVIYLFLGCIVETMSMILLTVPIFYPLVMALGFDPIWFGVIMVIVMEMGLITPPIGLNVYVISGVAKDVPVYTMFKGIAPFVVAMLVCIAILIAFPQLALFLPNLMK